MAIPQGIRIATLALLAAAVAGCHNYVNIPGQPGDALASNNPKWQNVRLAGAVAVDAAVEQRGLEGPLIVRVPASLDPQVRSRWLNDLTLLDLPVVHVVGRGEDATGRTAVQYGPQQVLPPNAPTPEPAAVVYDDEPVTMEPEPIPGDTAVARAIGEFGPTVVDPDRPQEADLTPSEPVRRRPDPPATESPSASARQAVEPGRAAVPVARPLTGDETLLEIEEIRLRGARGSVDIIRPGHDGVPQLVTVTLNWDPLKRWEAEGVRVWRVPVEQALTRSGQ